MVAAGRGAVLGSAAGWVVGGRMVQGAGATWANEAKPGPHTTPGPITPWATLLGYPAWLGFLPGPPCLATLPGLLPKD